MISDTITALSSLSQSILQLSATLERLPLGGMADPRLVSLATDPGALLDELLAPLVEGPSPPFVHDNTDAHSANSSGEPHLPQFTLSYRPQDGSRRQGSASRAAWPYRPRSIWHGDNNGYEQPGADPPTSGWQERTPPPDLNGSQHPQQVSDHSQHEQTSSTGSSSTVADLASLTAGNQANAPSTAFDRQGIRARHTQSFAPLHPSTATSRATVPDSEQFDKRGPDSEPFPAASAGGLRLAHGIAGLSALLKANTDRREQIGAPPNALRHSVQPTDSYQSHLDARDQPIIPSSAAMFDRATSAQNSRFMPSARLDALRHAAPDMEEIIRELEDRLEFEYLRMYGTTGD